MPLSPWHVRFPLPFCPKSNPQKFNPNKPSPFPPKGFPYTYYTSFLCSVLAAFSQIFNGDATIQQKTLHNRWKWGLDCVPISHWNRWVWLWSVKGLFSHLARISKKLLSTPYHILHFLNRWTLLRESDPPHFTKSNFLTDAFFFFFSLSFPLWYHLNA